MKKTITAFVILILFVMTVYANATVLNKENYKVNFPPCIPFTPTGATLLKVGYSYVFSTCAFDHNADKVQYQFDWDSTGFHDYSQWTEFFPSGQFVSFSHSWDASGVYVVKVQVKDEYGEISTWSDGLTVKVNYENQRRNIMLTGFWVPTSQMVARFSTNPYVNPDGWQGENWENLGYDIYSFVAKEYYNNNGTWEWRYQQIWDAFWNISNQLHPIAIIGFGQGAKANTWNIENKAINWNKWYLDDDGKQPSPNPPDDTVWPCFIRFSTLPIWRIEKAINNQTSINAKVNVLGTPGFYFCGYLAYLEQWYQAQHSDDDEFLCKAAGWIHVNKNISLEDCIEATNITIKCTIEKVKKAANVRESEPGRLLSNIKTANQNPINQQKTNYINQQKFNLLLFQILKDKTRY